MPTLQAIHGRLVEVRRFTNVHLYIGRRPLGPTDRYELWIKPPHGAERKFIINTRIMPARRGHEVSLIVTAHKVPQVLGLANWSTIDGRQLRPHRCAATGPRSGLRGVAGSFPGRGYPLRRYRHGAVRSGGGGVLGDGRLRAGYGADPAGCPGGPGYRCGGAPDEPICADAAMTIRFGNQVRLASRDRFRLMLLIERDPGHIVSFAELQALMQRHRAQVRGVSRDAEFLRWLMDREWNRLAPGSGYREPL
jgi:hypothetical protein